MMFWTRSSAFSERENVATNMKSMADIPQKVWTSKEMYSTSSMIEPNRGGF